MDFLGLSFFHLDNVIKCIFNFKFYGIRPHGAGWLISRTAFSFVGRLNKGWNCLCLLFFFANLRLGNPSKWMKNYYKVRIDPCIVRTYLFKFCEKGVGVAINKYVSMVGLDKHVMTALAAQMCHTWGVQSSSIIYIISGCCSNKL